jgi:signal-transduction protein with cAMP-binding, CBS, and nucleotidyltransferase domain
MGTNSLKTTIEELKNVIALSDLPDDHLQWILNHSDYHEYEDGTQIRKTGEEAQDMIMILKGSISFYLDVHGRLVYYYYFANDALSGGISGLLTYFCYHTITTRKSERTWTTFCRYSS